MRQPRIDHALSITRRLARFGDPTKIVDDNAYWRGFAQRVRFGLRDRPPGRVIPITGYARIVPIAGHQFSYGEWERPWHITLSQALDDQLRGCLRLSTCEHGSPACEECLR